MGTKLGAEVRVAGFPPWTPPHDPTSLPCTLSLHKPLIPTLGGQGGHLEILGGRNEKVKRRPLPRKCRDSYIQVNAQTQCSN